MRRYMRGILIQMFLRVNIRHALRSRHFLLARYIRRKLKGGENSHDIPGICAADNKVEQQKRSICDICAFPGT